MKKFTFRLETLEKVCRIRKDQAQAEFAQACAQLNAAQDRLAELQEQTARGMEAYRAVLQNAVTASRLRLYSDYFARQEGNIKRSQEQIKEAERLRLARLEALKKALNKLRVIERLRARRLEEFKAAALADEQKYLDEVGLQIYTRTGR